MQLGISNAALAVYIDGNGRIVGSENIDEKVKNTQRSITPVAERPHQHDASTISIQTRSGDNFYSTCCQFGVCHLCLKIGPIDYLKEIGLLTKRLLGMYPKPPQV